MTQRSILPFVGLRILSARLLSIHSAIRGRSGLQRKVEDRGWSPARWGQPWQNSARSVLGGKATWAHARQYRQPVLAERSPPTEGAKARLASFLLFSLLHRFPSPLQLSSAALLDTGLLAGLHYCSWPVGVLGTWGWSRYELKRRPNVRVSRQAFSSQKSDDRSKMGLHFESSNTIEFSFRLRISRASLQGPGPRTPQFNHLQGPAARSSA
jgi:hypothetical protein